MNINDISTQLLYTTVPIFTETQNHDISIGTGFIFSVREGEDGSIPLLITSNHIFKDAINGYFELHIGENGKPTNKTVRVQFDKCVIEGNKLGNLDAIAIPLASALLSLQKQGINVFFRAVDQNMIPSLESQQNFAAIEEVTFIGYPSGIYDDKNKLPITRRGVTATPIWNNFDGKDEFLVDGGVFPGSSGSPVFIFNQGSFSAPNGIVLGNRLLFVGIISTTLSHVNQTEKDYLNLGKVINGRAIIRELELFVNKIKQQ
ncbi:MAG: trypsin-like peptidase domain-containing protein [Succinivibrionaceae bacterium]|nr:trypsin-like peptidase domain-containing protein [Succinivibrionaceae bacterium]